MCCINSDGITAATLGFLWVFSKYFMTFSFWNWLYMWKRDELNLWLLSPCAVELPPEIENFINLQRLVRNSLHFQRLQRHEDLVSDSGCLSWKMLAENSLQRLPSTLGRLRSLKVLVLDSNQLSILPDEGNYLQNPLTDTVIEISWLKEEVSLSKSC